CAKYPSATIFGDACFITACNQAAADALSTANPSLKSKITVIHHGIDLQKWTFGDCQPPKPICKIAFVGRLVPKKGLEILIRALSYLKRGGMEFTLEVVGSGPLENELKTLAGQQGVEDSIHWHGVQPPEGVRSILRQSSCLCAPSVVAPNGDRDGIPNTVLEAMAVGLPVIATPVGGIAEALSNDKGWMIDFLSPLQLANTLTTFASTPFEERQRRIQNARKLIESDFDARKLARNRAKLFIDDKL
ncbi:MAG: glycosyltransferase family 4 protein, partial [Victivallales bacterium]|nr:glycosyltransferase family 4 protein [Victivallales bacterium]